MKISGQKSYLAGLESIAMTDIVMNLFIFFFISFSLLYTFNVNRLKKIQVETSKAQSSKTAKDNKSINISVAADGVPYLEKKAITLYQLKDEIDTLHIKNPDLRVLLHADKTTQFKYVADILNVLNNLNVQNVNIAVEAEKRR